jgi:hypothetical protein
VGGKRKRRMRGRKVIKEGRGREEEGRKDEK